VGVGVDDGEALGDGVDAGVGVGVAVGGGLGAGLGGAVGGGRGLGGRVGRAVGRGVPVGAGVGGGVGRAVADGVGFGVAVGAGVGVGFGDTVIVTVTTLDHATPSQTRYVNVSVPEKSLSALYLKLPSSCASRLPPAGLLTIWTWRCSPSASVSFLRSPGTGTLMS